MNESTSEATATLAEVVVHDDPPPALNEPAKKAPAKNGAPKWETETRERVKASIRKFTKPLADLIARDANEGDTRFLVTDFLCEAFGYDKYEDLTTEYAVKGEFADYGIRIDKQLVAFIEVKRCTTKLGAKHLRQVEMYAVNEGVEWMILTNGAVWQVYHLTGGLPVVIDLAMAVDLSSDESVNAKANELFYLTREAMKRRLMDELWKAKAATSPKSLAAVVLSDAVTDAVRKELRRTTGHNVEAKQIANHLRETVIRPDALA